MKIAINACFGGFGLSPKAKLRLYERGVTEIATPVDEYFPLEHRERQARDYPAISYESRLAKWRQYLSAPEPKKGLHMPWVVFSPDEKFVLVGERDLPRNHPEMIRVIEELGRAASGMASEVCVVEIPDDVNWKIEEYDGREWVAEVHRTWCAE